MKHFHASVPVCLENVGEILNNQSSDTTFQWFLAHNLHSNLEQNNKGILLQLFGDDCKDD